MTRPCHQSRPIFLKMEPIKMNLNEIDAWVMERFGEGYNWTLLRGGLTPQEEDKVYYRIPDFHVLEKDGTCTLGIAILWEGKD